MTQYRFPGPARLATAIAAALAALSTAHAATITVSASCPLASAITTANTDVPVVGCDPAGSGADTIQIGDNVVIDGELPAIVSDIDFVGTGVLPSAINGDGLHRLLRIGDETHAPTVTFTPWLGLKGSGGGPPRCWANPSSVQRKDVWIRLAAGAPASDFKKHRRYIMRTLLSNPRSSPV